MLPVELVVSGIPASLQAKGSKKRAWKQQIEAAARAALGDNPPTAQDVFFSVETYYTGELPDVDNIIKPIQDALSGVVYFDDSQVVATLSAKRPLSGTTVIPSANASIASALAARADFVVVRVSSAAAPHYRLP